MWAVEEPECRFGVAGSGSLGGLWPWSGGGGQGADAGEDLVEQVVFGWQAQDERAGVADKSGWDTDQPVSQGGDHGVAAADAMPGQLTAGPGGRGELV